MHVDPESNSNCDIGIDANADSDSLFGSPPPSPGVRGRSPSPLALPSAAGCAQNVGTLALPGSHLVAEASVHPPVSFTLSDRSTNAVQSSRSQFVLPQSRRPPPPPPLSSPAPNCSTSVESRHAPAQRKSKKGKERAYATSRSSTPRPAPPPIELPSPDEPLPPNFLRNQQALLGLAGVVGGVNPAQLSMQRGTSAQNPIVIQDSDPPVGGPLTSQPSISRRPMHVPFGSAQLPRPSNEEILATLLRQGNILPVVESLIRLLSAPVPAVSVPPRLPVRTGWERTDPSAAPPLKRRKLNKVPAGATDWDMPYPFQEGQGPQGYQSTWARERARALLADLVGLIQGAAKKAAAKGYYQQQERERQRRWMEERDGVNKSYYRPRTAFYGLAKGSAVGNGQGQSEARGQVATSVASTPALGSSGLPVSTNRQSMSEPPAQASMSFDELFGSLLVASTTHQSEEALESTSTATQSHTGSPSPGSSDNFQPFIDDWLSMLDSFPPGDPHDMSLLPDFDSILNEFASTSPAAAPNSTDPSSISSGDVLTSTTTPAPAEAQCPLAEAYTVPQAIPDFLIDPVLFELPAFPASTEPQPAPEACASGPLSIPSPESNSLQASGTASVSGAESSTDAPCTPALTAIDAGSPLPSTASLADRELGPATPEWAWAFSEPDIMGLSGADDVAGQFGGMGGEDVSVSAEEMRAFERELEKACAPADVKTSTQDKMEVRTADQGALQEQGTAAASEDEILQAHPFLVPMELDNAISCAAPAYLASQTEPLQEQDRHARVTQNQVEAGTAEAPHLPQTDALVGRLAQDLTPISPASQNQELSDTLVQLTPASQQQSLVPSSPQCQVPVPSSGQHPSPATSASPSSASPYAALSSLLSLAGPTTVAQKVMSKHARGQILERARALRTQLERARERARVELWEVTVEQGCLVGIGRELGANASGTASVTGAGHGR